VLPSRQLPMNDISSPEHKRCRRCNRILDVRSRFCSDCGFDFNRTPSLVRWNKIIPILGGVLILIIIVALTVHYSHKNKQSTISPDPTPVTYTAGPGMSDKANNAELKIVQGQALQASDLDGLSALELRILRNAVFAYRGRRFDQSGQLEAYYYARPWYRPRDDYNESMLTTIDRSNIDAIKSHEASAPARPSATQVATQPITLSLEEQALVEAKKVWHQYFTQCGDTYVAEETSRMTMHAMEPGSGNKISQFKGVLSLHPARLGEAERLNNIEYYAELWFVYDAERIGSPEEGWTAWRGPGQMGHNNQMRDLSVMRRAGTWIFDGNLTRFNKWRRVNCSVLPD
jgi:ribosomal protein L37E